MQTESLDEMAWQGELGLHATLGDVLRWRAINQPSRVAFRFMPDGESEGASLTYHELHLQAKAVAAGLASRCKPGDRALLLYPPGMDFISAFFGCIYAGVVAVPLYCPRLNRNDARVQSVVSNSRAAIALTTAELLEKLEKSLHQIPCLEALARLATDDLGSSLGGQTSCELIPEGIAFLQYTSGSTANPRGVMVSHSSLMANQRMITSAMALGEESLMVSWLPVFHDMGLIGNTLNPVYAGYTSVHMPPAAFLQHPRRWLEAASRYRATIIGAPNFAYDLCVRRVQAEHRAQLDLSALKIVYCGAEPIRAATAREFCGAFAASGLRSEAFYPCYGMAEATLFVSGGRQADTLVLQSVSASALANHRVELPASGAGDEQLVVGCGRQRHGSRVVIADPETLSEVRGERVGEIWIQGPHVARGYWCDDDRTADTFGAYLSDTGEGPFLRSGDLGFVRGEELFVTGRLKDLIIIRGRNHYPQDIEFHAERSHSYIRPSRCAAFSVSCEGEERLAIVCEIDREFCSKGLVDVVRAIRRSVSESHELAVHTIVLVRPLTIPTTTSGKLQRRLCRSMIGNGQIGADKILHVEGELWQLAQATPQLAMAGS